MTSPQRELGGKKTLNELVDYSRNSSVKTTTFLNSALHVCLLILILALVVLALEIMQKIAQQHFQSPSILAVLPIQDIFALSDKYNDRDPASEAINDPTNPKHYWR